MRQLLAIALIAALPGQGMAAGALDVMFSRPHMEAVQPGDKLRYQHHRTSAQQDRVGPNLETVVHLDVKGSGEAREVTVTLDADGAARQLETFRDVPGNPILMVFFESVVVSISRATGGSPFYIRNRIKESFERGTVSESGEATTVLIHPFENDRNRAKMGPFADLEITLALDTTKPGQFERLAATVPGTAEQAHYAEEFSLVRP